MSFLFKEKLKKNVNVKKKKRRRLKKKQSVKLNAVGKQKLNDNYRNNVRLKNSED